MKNLTYIVLIATATVSSCKSQSKAMETNKIEQNSSKNQATTKETVYDITISFISKASGIDIKLKAKIDTILSDFNKKNKTDLKPEIAPWGREGELDYLFITKNLSTKQKNSLIAQFKATIGSSDMAYLILDKKSVHKR